MEAEGVLMYYFRDGMNRGLYHACMSHGLPDDIHVWYQVATKSGVGTDRVQEAWRSQRPTEKKPFSWVRRPQPPHPPPNEAPRHELGLYFRCSKEGHRATTCPVPKPMMAPKAPSQSKTKKTPKKAREKMLVAYEILEVSSPTSEG